MYLCEGYLGELVDDDGDEAGGELGFARAIDACKERERMHDPVVQPVVVWLGKVGLRID